VSSAESAVRGGTGHDLSARLAGWLTMARISNSPTVASDVLAGAALAGAVEPSAAIGLLVVAMVAFYTAGMLLNDVCDFTWDRSHRPNRPLVVGVVSRPAGTVATIALFGVGLVLLWVVGPRAFLAGVVLVGVIVLYDVWHKSNPLSPLVMAACRLMVYVCAFAAFAWLPTVMLFLAGAAMVAYLVGLTAIAKSEARPAVLGYWPAVLLFVPAAYVFVHPSLVAFVFAAALIAWAATCSRFVYRQTDRRIGLAIGRLIAGVSLLDGLVLAVSGAPALTICLSVLAFGLTLLLQRYVEGT
jgi:hypothetical protein